MSEPKPGTATDWTLVALLFVAGLFASAQFAKIALTLGPLADVYPDWSAWLPATVSAISLSGILFATIAGEIVARLGVRRVLLAGLVCSAGVSFAEALLPPFPWFLGLRLAEGLAHLSLVVAAPTAMAAMSSDRDRPVVMGLWGTFFGVGFALAALAVPPLVASGGTAAVFAAHGAGLALLAGALWWRLPRIAASPVRGAGGAGIVARHLAIYRTLHIVAPALLFFWHTVMFLGLLTFVPRFIGEGMSPVLPLVALIGTMGAGYLARHAPPMTIGSAGFAVSLVLALALVIVPDGMKIWVSLPLFVALGIAPGAAFAAVPALNRETADQARANGALAQLGNVGTALSTPVVAATVPFGLAGPMLLATALCAAGLAVTVVIHRNLARRC